jgi:apolipoprotein N-acyltransferase
MNQALVLSWLKVFAAAVLAGVLTATVTDVWDWRALLFSGLAAVLPVVINWLDPNDTRYGRGSE